MAADDPERDSEKARTAEERALARARAVVEAAEKPKRKDPGRWLALVPVTIAVVMMALMMPRATVPDTVPLPAIDGRALRATVRADDDRTARATEHRLPTDVLAVGSAVRALEAAQQAEPSDKGVAAIEAARAQLEGARRGLGSRSGWEDDLLALRAVQMRAFLDELRRYESTGVVSKDLEELGGGFVRRMGTSGWLDGRRIVLDEAQRRVAFKIAWNAIVGVETFPQFRPTLDEERALYTLYLMHPHASEPELRALESMRRAATTAEGCARAASEDRRAREGWRAEKIKRLGAIDPTYPTAYALGVAYYRAGRYDLSVDAFRVWIEAHPDGPWAARAKNHLKAALAAYGSS